MPHATPSNSLGFIIADLARMNRAAFEKRVNSAGLAVTAAEARALLNINVLGPARQTRIAEKLGIEPMTASAYIDRLEQQGLVTRQTDPCDRRANLVTVTEAAGAVIADVRAEMNDFYDRVLHDFSQTERDALTRTLMQLRVNYETVLSEWCQKAPAE